MVKKCILPGLLICTMLFAHAQVSCFVETQLDRNSVYAQQPFKITITVLTATWYTAPLDFDNLAIPNAFILPFERTTPGMFNIKGKQYAGLTFYYIVFPYKAGKFTLPQINIVATTPPPGSAQSQKVTVKTQPLRYLVKSVPKNFSSDNWFVAKDVVLAEKWNRPLKNLKVGDVIYRTIIVDAKGTLPQFIPDLRIDSLDWAGVYPGRISLADTRDDYDANGTRTQTITYLLEKEGDFALPAARVTWFNPNTGRVFKTSTPGVKLRVAANPNLGILQTLKDSLNHAGNPVKATINVKKGPYVILGIPWYYFALYSLAAICLCYFIIRAILWMYGYFRNKRDAYLISEGYWFSKFSRSSPGWPALLKNLYAWWDHFPLSGKSASIQKDTAGRNAADIARQLAAFYQQAYAGENREVKMDNCFKKDIKKYRSVLKRCMAAKAERNISREQTEWKL
jgi:hypothetical protein